MSLLNSSNVAIPAIGADSAGTAAQPAGREKTQLPVYAKLGVNWSTTDKFVDETLVPNMSIMRPRGDT